MSISNKRSERARARDRRENAAKEFGSPADLVPAREALKASLLRGEVAKGRTVRFAMQGYNREREQPGTLSSALAHLVGIGASYDAVTDTYAAWSLGGP